MKTIAYVSAFAIALLIYSSGAFVPETQGITETDTVLGLVVLSDTDLAQHVGGNWEGYPVLKSKGGGEADCNIGNCGTKDDCLLNRTVSKKARYKCKTCPTGFWARFISKYERVFVQQNKVTWCSWNHETETCDKKRTGTGTASWTSCENPLGMCEEW